ncbi:MAG TPA: hypothetical protein VGQ90_00795 [Stellaceae bacterium]|nr:hypothetical protein [Stellaceae bacterium]
MEGSGFPMRLLDDERLLWSGGPSQGLLLTARDWFMVPGSLLFLGFAIYWEAEVLSSQAPGLFGLFGVPFILVGLYVVAGRFAVDAWLRARTRYALTDRRIVITRSGSFGKTTSLALDRLPDMQLSLWLDGRGTIRFGVDPPFLPGRRNTGGWTPSLDPTPQFIGIDDAQSVFDRLQRAKDRGA